MTFLAYQKVFTYQNFILNNETSVNIGKEHRSAQLESMKHEDSHFLRSSATT